ncbi:hypothetical protein [Sphingobacterium faecale]|uniref:Uncharacterized protein n=1 Tax=Sphingobacterium faecale TaxID=2803775 RepID=A0ABS1R1X6_9SPHI|nr:hypothetical protein [Sphingobacterium faecale]MBL1408052.1 hypothetical protein [Sphingobacterium faecale]
MDYSGDFNVSESGNMMVVFMMMNGIGHAILDTAYDGDSGCHFYDLQNNIYGMFDAYDSGILCMWQM